jgi:hypothetical protein
VTSNHQYVGVPHQALLTYEGAETEQNLISLYDLSRSLLGFERSLALTTHFVLHNEVITQVTSLRGARILCATPKPGSYKIPAYIVALGTAVNSLGTLEANNPIGHVVFSVYSMVIQEAMGQKVDYDKSLHEIYEKGIKEGTDGFLMPKKSQIESLVEKVEPAVLDMHRPMVSSGTAEHLSISDIETTKNRTNPLIFDRASYDSLRFKKRADDIITIVGKVSSFNMNTFNGRLYSSADQRPISFFLSHAARTDQGVQLVGQSLANNIKNPSSDDAFLQFDVIQTHSRTGRATRFLVIKVRKLDQEQFEVIEPI